MYLETICVSLLRTGLELAVSERKKRKKPMLCRHWFCGTHKLPTLWVGAVVQIGMGAQTGKIVFISISVSW